MPTAVLDRSALDSLFSGARAWPSDADWARVARETAEHIIEHPETGMLMVLVPAGKFLTDTGGGAAFEVDLPAYYIGVHPVTNAQYAPFVAEQGGSPPASQVWQESEKQNHPVTNVNLHKVRGYCMWAGLRLPTELEWEKAARGLDGRAYPWGNDWNPSHCQNARNIVSMTTANVWRYGKGGSPFGGLQLSGNVWELCADPHDAKAYARYRQGNLSLPPGGFISLFRVVRGGSWQDDRSSNFSASNRSVVISRSDPGLPLQAPRGDVYGFRCALAASP